LPYDGTADYTDTDDDGMNNWREWRAGTDPTNAVSVLRLLSLSNSPPGLTIRWRSVTNRTYFVERSGSLSGPSSFEVRATNVAGQAEATTYSDTITGSGPFFYRVGVQE
jgi:hypothetical protein